MLARPEQIAMIKHIFILVKLVQPDSILSERRALSNLKQNVQTIVNMFRASDNQLFTLRMRYESAFGGEFEDVREVFEAPLPPNMVERPAAMIRKTLTGELEEVHARELGEKVFKNINILDPFKALKGIADFVDIRGDLPCVYRDELAKILSSANPGAMGTKMRKAQAQLAAAR